MLSCPPLHKPLGCGAPPPLPGEVPGHWGVAWGLSSLLMDHNGLWAGVMGSCVALEDINDMIHNTTLPSVKPLLWVRYLGIPNWTWININSVDVVFLGFYQGFFPTTSLAFPHHLADLVRDHHFDQDCTATKSCPGSYHTRGCGLLSIHTQDMVSHPSWMVLSKSLFTVVCEFKKSPAALGRIYFWICIIPNGNFAKCYQLQANILALTDLWILGCFNQFLLSHPTNLHYLLVLLRN